VINGTLFPLAFAPMMNGEDFYTRKGDYTIKGLVIRDSAFSTSAVMIPAFKTGHNTNLSEEKK